MQALRNATVLARLVLAWFALTLGVAVAAPMHKQLSYQQVCSATGSITLVADSNANADADTGKSAGHHLNCPLCVFGAGAPATAVTPFVPRPPNAAGLPLADTGHRVTRAAAAMPARGPPLGTIT